MVPLGYLPGGSRLSAVHDMSADGSVLVGQSHTPGMNMGCRWTQATAMVNVGDLPGGNEFSCLFGVSPDGSIAVGWGTGTAGREAIRMTGSTMAAGDGLGDLPGGAFYSTAHDLSNDGSVVVGGSESSSGAEAFRWTADTGMVGLGDLPGGAFESHSTAVSADGSVIVGIGVTALGREAFIWDAHNGIRNLAEVLVNDYGFDLTDWRLSEALGISDDGLTIIGAGINPSGNTEAWIANVPEPSTLLLLCVGAVGFGLFGCAPTEALSDPRQASGRRSKNRRPFFFESRANSANRGRVRSRRRFSAENLDHRRGRRDTGGAEGDRSIFRPAFFRHKTSSRRKMDQSPAKHPNRQPPWTRGTAMFLRSSPRRRRDCFEVTVSRRRGLTATILAAAAFLPVILGTVAGRAEPPSPPNIVIIFADDLGYGDLGCYGHPTIRTPQPRPHGRRGDAVHRFLLRRPRSARPSRAALLTGRYPIRSGMCHDRFRVLRRNSAGGLPGRRDHPGRGAEGARLRHGVHRQVAPGHLRQRPDASPARHGFDLYFGLPYSNDMNPTPAAPHGAAGRLDQQADWWNAPLYRDEQLIERPADQTTLTRRYTDEAVQFIREHKDGPFFLYFPHTLSARAAVRLGASSAARARAGSTATWSRNSTGASAEVLETLRREGLDENTLVFFTSDNGPWLIQGEAGGSAGLLRDGKGSTWEGGMREPGIAWWPGADPARHGHPRAGLARWTCSRPL